MAGFAVEPGSAARRCWLSPEQETSRASASSSTGRTKPGALPGWMPCMGCASVPVPQSTAWMFQGCLPQEYKRKLHRRRGCTASASVLPEGQTNGGADTGSRIDADSSAVGAHDLLHE